YGRLLARRHAAPAAPARRSGGRRRRRDRRTTQRQRTVLRIPNDRDVAGSRPLRPLQRAALAMTTRVLVLFVCAAAVLGACGSSAKSAQNGASVSPIAVVGGMRPNLPPRVFTFDAPTGARSDLAHSDGGSDPAVSPDRALVAFAGKAGAYPALFVVPAAGGDAVQVTTEIPCAGTFAHPTWSPDGREIAFEVFF